MRAERSIDRRPVDERINQIARQVGRLRPDWHNHERFFEERSELEAELRKIARQVANG